MKAKLRTLGRVAGGCFIVSAAFLGCKSKLESAGDKFLKAGDPINAVMYYDRAQESGKISREFPVNYAKASIQVMRARAASDPAADILDVYKDTLVSIIRRSPHPENEADLARALVDVGLKRMAMGVEEGAFRFFQAAQGLSKSADVGAKINEAKSAYVAAKLKEAESDLGEITKEDPSPGIVADYKLNHLAMVVGEETPEMKALWSKVRQKNLPTYLMYDLEELQAQVGQVDSRINKYGILMGIVKYSATGGKVAIQAKVWNGTSGPLELDGSNFSLVDDKGNSYEPASKIGAFGKKALVAMREESKTGGVSFNVPADAKPAYIELKTDDGRVSRKYLP